MLPYMSPLTWLVGAEWGVALVESDPTRLFLILFLLTTNTSECPVLLQYCLVR